MIIATSAQFGRYSALHPLFMRVFEFTRDTNLLTLAPGRYPIIDERLLVIIEHTVGRSREDAQLECHRRYIDIQWVLAGVDEMGWRATADCSEPVDDYNSERDIQFFRDHPVSWIATPRGAFCIFFPEDAHAPLVSNEKICKAIFKVAAEHNNFR
ncbi:biofilm protein TabA [Gammaproteobacteria bacterium]